MLDKKFFIFLLGCLLFIVSGAAMAAETENDNTIVIINGQPLSKQEFQVFVKSRMGNRPNRNITQDQLKKLTTEYINRELMYQEALKKGYAKKPEIMTAIDNTQRNIIASYRAREIISKPISEEVLRKAYDENLVKPEQEFKVSHILVKKKLEALEIIKALLGGKKNFAELAREKSIDVSAKNGGDLGWVSESQLIAPLRKIIPNMKPGTFSTTAVNTQYGWHVIWLAATRNTKPPTFDSLKDKIRTRLRNDMLVQHIKELRKNSTIIIK